MTGRHPRYHRSISPYDAAEMVSSKTISTGTLRSDAPWDKFERCDTD